jgi:TonB-linked SusC/RagA family outer membrane protein
MVLSFVLVFVGAQAQDKTIDLVKGIVKSETGEILTGASVMVKGSKQTTSAGKDGSFTLKNVPATAVIRISCVGHYPKEVKLREGQDFVEVRLGTNASTLTGVVVNTGLYRRPAGNFTGAAKSFTGEELKLVNPVNVLQALAVVEPSLRIVENNEFGSDPNKLPIIQLRGQNNLPVSTQGTLESGDNPVSNGDIMSSYLLNPNQPLIILDGFQTTLQAIYDLDINRIASITVLKDAAATVAYGSKAANGVIVVETKQPLPGKVQVSYSINTGIELPDLSSYHLMDAKGLLEAQRLAGMYSDPNNNYRDVALKQWYDYRLYQVQSGVNTYWLSQPLRTGYSLNHSLSIGGGLGKLRYNLALSYGDGNGVMKGSGRKTYGLNYNLNYVLNNLRFSNSTTVSVSRAENSPWGSYSDYSSQFPYFRPYDSAGNILKIFEPSALELGIAVPAPGKFGINSMYNSTLNVMDNNQAFSYSNATNLDWTITNNLRMKTSVRFSTNLPEAEQFFPADHTSFDESFSRFTDLGSYAQTKGKNTAIDGKIGLDYNKQFGKHMIYSSVGFSAQQTNSTATTLKTTGIPNDYLGQLGLADGYGLSLKPSSGYTMTRSISQYLSVSYNYNERYTAEVTANASGSSQFGANNRFAPFWAGGLSWNVDKEKFFKRNNLIQGLKFRYSTGVTGNQNFAASMSQASYLYNLTNIYRVQLGASVEGYANPNLKWQQTLKNNLGVQMSLLNNRVMLGADIFLEKTDNLILPLDVAPSTGFTTYQDNLGAVENKGYEVHLSLPIIRNRAKNIFWSLSFNTGHAVGVITKLSPAIEAINEQNNAVDNTGDGAKKQQKPLPRFVVGQSMSMIWAVPSLGIDPATGKEVFQKLDGSKTFIWDPRDKAPIGDANSKFKGMFGSNLTFKAFTFNFNLAYQYGGYKYNQTLVDKIENVDLAQTNADTRVLTDRWKKPGDQASFKALAVDVSGPGLKRTNATSRFVQRDNFIEASSVTVGYTFPSNLRWVKKLKLSTPRIFITENQVLRLATIEVERGTAYPFSRRFNFGLSTTL